MNRQEWDEMVKKEEARQRETRLRPFPGFGSALERFNWYVCPKGHRTITKDIDLGTTPASIACPACGPVKSLKDLAWSKFYQVPQIGEPDEEFYRPSFEETQKIKYQPLREHIEMGGLIFRSLNLEEYHVEDPAHLTTKSEL